MCIYIHTYVYMCFIYLTFLTKQCLIKIPSCHLHIASLYTIFNVHPSPLKKNRFSPSCPWSLSEVLGGVASWEG